MNAEFKRILAMIDRLHEELPELNVCASIGILGPETAAALARHGIAITISIFRWRRKSMPVSLPIRTGLKREWRRPPASPGGSQCVLRGNYRRG